MTDFSAHREGGRAEVPNMMRQPRLRHSLLRRSTACLFTVTAVFFFALPAAATIISHSGTFEDPSDPEGDGDQFTLTNNPTSEANIITLDIDLSFAPPVPGVSFDPGDFPFTPTAASATPVGRRNAAASLGRERPVSVAASG